MKSLFVALTMLFLGTQLDARSARVSGYRKKSGAYVAPHQRTAPNKTKKDNWSHKGNVNPYTGKEGTKE